MIFFYLIDIFFRIQFFDFQYSHYIKLNLDPNIMLKNHVLFSLLNKNSLIFLMIQLQMNNYNSDD